MKPRIDTSVNFSGVDEAGNRRCVWCGRTPLPPYRQRWCSDQCVQEYEIKAMPSRVRARVDVRDRGICALCGLDTARVAEWVRKIPVFSNVRAPQGRKDRFSQGDHWGRFLGRHRARALTLLGRLWGVALHGRKTFWDMDHTLPVVEGGGGCGLEGYRTLCRKCHHKETVALRGRMRRRPIKGMMK